MATRVTTESKRLIPTDHPWIYRRGSGYVFRYIDPQGKTRQRAARTLAEARRLKAELHTDVSRGEYREYSRMTLDEYASQWFLSYQGRTSRGIRPSTLADYKHELELYALPRLGRLRLSEIEPRHLKELAAFVSAGGKRKPRTVQLAIAPLRALLATANEEGLIRGNPAAGLRIAIPLTLDDDDDDVPEQKALTGEQLSALLSEVPAPYRPFVTFVAQSGLRIGEAIAVQWRDIDLENASLKVRRRFYKGEYGPPKTRYGRRTIPLTPGMTALLRERRALLGAEPGELVWPNRNGLPLDPTNAGSRVLKPAAQRAGVPWLSWHTLRHTCGTLLFREGWSIKAVQHYLGHHSPAFTLAVYVHFLPGDMPSNAFLDELIGGRPGSPTS